jgi:hypothetical protein
MRSNKTFLLIIFVISLSAMMAVVRELRIAGYLTLETQLVAAYLVFGLNLVVATGGLWTRFRLAWLLYLVCSIASMLFLGSSTPFSAAWILIKYVTRLIFT